MGIGDVVGDGAKAVGAQKSLYDGSENGGSLKGEKKKKGDDGDEMERGRRGWRGTTAVAVDEDGDESVDESGDESGECGEVRGDPTGGGGVELSGHKSGEPKGDQGKGKEEWGESVRIDAVFGEAGPEEDADVDGDG
jgi:hypothetical protein